MIILFIFLPLFAFVLSHINPNWRHARIVILAYCCLYSISLPINQKYDGDAIRYVEHFLDHIDNGYSFTERFWNLYTDTANIEILPGIIYATIGYFTNNPQFLLAAFGLIYGYFYSGNIVYLRSFVVGKMNAASLPMICILTASMMIPVWYSNGFRFWTASLIFIYSTLPIIMERNYSKLLFLIVAASLHSSFIFFSMILIAILVPKRLTAILAATMIVSVLLKNTISVDFVIKKLEVILPSIFYNAYGSYFGEVVQDIEGGRFIGPLNQLINIFIQIAVFFIWLMMKDKIAKRDELTRTLNFTICIYIAVNIMSGIPTLQRFYTIAYYFSFVFMYIAMICCQTKRIVQYLILVSAVFGMLGIAVNFLAEGIKMTGITAVLVPLPLIPFLFEDNVALNDLVGYLMYIIWPIVFYLVVMNYKFTSKLYFFNK